ncbi:hydroxymethylglutaryl-CoA reductase, degradative [Aequorivita lipolytica]|uniref:3-hydroxy-3-methylglutaryl coenzyme A reductase n=1 Tax=Aequorivita lipolytica TaxID=153267 RepID=A0A5C6YQQ5_9FLAO|nr:hydroxymethylglutaryl-CoA reductase, degradative [Aequorivita lipolytica]TXD69882.1 hydroxymethylglutaryl-CoA reductase, degradative [Aequorivita lipolytica]SRX50298.1 3-hydroxy-3-methylglutaryl-coenzyme A reductase [Aequorivita lipolytica]
MIQPISGFSKKTKAEKIEWLAENYLQNNPNSVQILENYWNDNPSLQQLHDDFIENTISNYYLPFGIAPNFLINEKLYALPMVTEESSVVAAASNAAKFWLERGGFKAEVISTEKNGQIHFNFFGSEKSIEDFFEIVKPKLRDSIQAIEKNMKARGGGLLELSLVDKSHILEGYFYIHATFETLDAMGANFINSCLEQMAQTFEEEARNFEKFQQKETFPEVVMSILSNYVPECLVRAEVSCKVEELTTKQYEGKQVAEKFVRAIEIAKTETRRAVTHNKGIMNGIDAVVLATGNDFRAVEAGVHAYAARNSYYGSLTHAKIEDGVFTFWIELPLAVGTVGGLTSLHPLTKLAFEILQKPYAKQLMKILAVAGLAQNFAAVRSLVTTGIQKGHMKMHLMNILNQLNATKDEKNEALEYYKENAVSHSSVVSFLENLRS